MGIIQFILLCVVVGIVVWLVLKLPLPAPIKTVILWGAVAVLVLILCSALGLFGHDIQIPKLR